MPFFVIILAEVTMGSGGAVCYNNKNNIKILGKKATTWCGAVAGPGGQKG